MASNLSRTNWGAVGCITIIVGGGIAVMFAGLSYLVASLLAPDMWCEISLGGAVLSLPFYIWFLAGYLRDEKYFKDRATLDVRANRVEILSVEPERVELIDAINNSSPAYLFALGGGELLLLHGQWLEHPAIYGTPGLVCDATHEYFSHRLIGFPSNKFSLIRFPNSGRVLGIDVHGDPVTDIGFIPAIETKKLLCDSERFRGAQSDFLAWIQGTAVDYGQHG